MFIMYVQVHTHSTALENISMTTEAINAEKKKKYGMPKRCLGSSSISIGR